MPDANHRAKDFQKTSTWQDCSARMYHEENARKRTELISLDYTAHPNGDGLGGSPFLGVLTIICVESVLMIFDLL